MIPIFTEFAEWQKSPSGASGIMCQDCHMPGAVAEVAPGSPPRAGVPHHGFMGEDGELARRALELSLVAKRKGARVTVTTTVRNQGAGHAMPAGLPGRQLVLRVFSLDAAGTELARREVIYTRRLVDARGAEVPFYRAVAEAADSRIAAGEARAEALVFDNAEKAKAVRAALFIRAISPDITGSLSAEAVAEVLIHEEKTGIGVAASPKTKTNEP